ncbi:MAG: hypothetical protein AAFO72_04805 [Pseudomonadota bacterium]
MKAWLICLSTWLAGPALALSCLPSDVAYSFSQADAAGEDYIVVHGTLEFDPPDAAGSDALQTAPDTTRLRARLNGKALDRSGFETTFSQDVTLDLICVASWCGYAESGKSYLAFLKRDGSDYVLTIDPCYAWLFPSPNEAQLQQVVSCMRGNCRPGAE